LPVVALVPGLLRSPLAFNLLTMVAWSVWSVVAAVATGHVSPEVVMAVSHATGAVVAFGYVLTRPMSVAFSTRGFGIAAVAGVAVWLLAG
jgi:hypothetical protein